LLLGLGRVSHLWFGYGFGNFPLKIPNFSIFCTSGKKNVIWSGRKVPGSEPGKPLIYCRSKVCSDQVGSRPISSLCPEDDSFGSHGDHVNKLTGLSTPLLLFLGGYLLSLWVEIGGRLYSTV